MNYKIIDAADIAALTEIVGGERILTGNGINPDYAHDELGGVERMPDILIRVKSEDEIASVMKYACAKRIPVVARGSGTGLVGGAVAINGGIMLETTLMNNILELDTDNFTVTVEPGVLLMELSKYVEERGMFYPPDPGEKSATIGGNISTNAGGMRAVKYGVTRDYVRGLNVVLPTGEVLELGGKVVKNSTGYSIKDLIVGSEGTLGIVSKAILKIIPLPKKTISLLVPFDSIETAIDTVPVIVRSGVLPTAIEFMERETILFAEDYLGKAFPDTRHNAYILMSFDGDSKEQVESDYTAIAELCLAKGARDVYIVDTKERKDSVWTARGTLLEAIKASTSEIDECDVVVPRGKVAQFIHYTHEVANLVGIRIPSFGHAGDGNLHVYVCRDDLPEDEWKARHDRAFDLLYARAAEMGGLVSGEHGVGFSKREYMLRQYEPEQVALMRRIKDAFDPAGILNKGKVCE